MKINSCRLTAVVEIIILFLILVQFVIVYAEGNFDFMAMGSLIVYSPTLIILTVAAVLNWIQRAKRNKISLIIDSFLLLSLALTLLRYFNVWEAGCACWESLGLTKQPTVTALDNILAFLPFYRIDKLFLGVITVVFVFLFIRTLKEARQGKEAV